jgi:hypothetical protein
MLRFCAGTCSAIPDKYKDNFNIISKRYNCFIKLPLLKIEKLAYKDIINKQ